MYDNEPAYVAGFYVLVVRSDGTKHLARISDLEVVDEEEAWR